MEEGLRISSKAKGASKKNMEMVNKKIISNAEAYLDLYKDCELIHKEATNAINALHGVSKTNHSAMMSAMKELKKAQTKTSSLKTNRVQQKNKN